MNKIIGVDKDITILDKVDFILNTTDGQDCPMTPYKINNVTIYFVSRDFVSNSVNQYEKTISNDDLLKQLEEAKINLCNYPTQENINKLNTIKIKVENSNLTSSFYFKEATPIKIFGSDEYPAWLDPNSVDPEEYSNVEQNNILKPYKENNELITGKFVLEWDTYGSREGDYFVCWHWKPTALGDTLSSHMMFSLLGETKSNVTIPTHITKPNKYEILMEKYLPDMFKTMLSDNDLSPQVLQELNASVAKGFTFIEDMANQIIDLFDSNVIQEQFLSLLSNLFDLQLKSNDSVLWRRQIKRAIPNFKKKGTKTGLKRALSDAGMELKKLTNLWQLKSKYTYQEMFEKTADSFYYVESNRKFFYFKLAKTLYFPQPGVPDEQNVEVYYRSKNSESWSRINYEYTTEKGGWPVNLTTQSLPFIGEASVATWTGDSDEAHDIIPLNEGDCFRVIYQFKEIPNLQEQNLETYVRILDLMDQRDERNQSFPPKNWNIRVIEQDDPLFDVLIPIRTPIQNPLVWGTIRTEFPYSENVYNMEEYNGSIRDSLDPCDIDKYFIDPCSDSSASKFSLDLEIDQLSDDRIIESQKIVEDYVPMHALIHNINFIGSMNDLLKPPIEQITALLHGSSEEMLIAGEAQNIFNRSLNQVILPSDDLENPTLEDPAKPEVYYPLSRVRRNLLSNMNDKTGSVNGTAFNGKIILYAPSLSSNSELEDSNRLNRLSSFDNSNINTSYVGGNALDNSNLLEILYSVNSGLYSVSNITKDSFQLLGTVTEPLNKSQFEFRISNKLYNQSSASIAKAHSFIFNPNLDLSDIKIISQEDIDKGYETGSCSKIQINESGYSSYNILKILPDNKFLLQGPMPNSDISGIDWELLNTDIAGEVGSIAIERLGLVDLSAGIASGIDDIRNYIKIGDYLYYNGNQYKIKSFVQGENFKFYIQNYNIGDVSGVDVSIYRRIVENCVGHLDYQGLILETSSNYEDLFEIQNGSNFSGIKTKTSNLKENYLILIDSNYYSILDINGTTITLDGPYSEWTTFGTSVDFVMYQFINQPVSLDASLHPNLPSHDFSQITRSNNEIIDSNIKTSTPIMPTIIRKILNSKQSDSEIIELSKQTESIKIKIEYDNGNIEEKQL